MSLSKKSIFSILLITPLLIGAQFWYKKPKTIRFSYEELQAFREDLRPLLDVIASGEGDYTSVNRGRAGDSQGDWAKAHIGKSITEMTLAELRAHQGGRDSSCWYKGKKGEHGLYAVGRYQLIPCTLQLATTQIEELDMDLLYSPEVQDTFGVYLILVKRPKVRDYLSGLSNKHKEAGQELAKEFASIPIQYSNGRCNRGQSYYCGDSAGNKAHIELKDINKAMRQVRRDMKRKGDLRLLISEKETLRMKIKRWWNDRFQKKEEPRLLEDTGDIETMDQASETQEINPRISPTEE